MSPGPGRKEKSLRTTIPTMHFMGLFRSVLSENVAHYGARFKSAGGVEVKRTYLDNTWARHF